MPAHMHKAVLCKEQKSVQQEERKAEMKSWARYLEAQRDLAP